jgi:hypothetical protein
MGTMIDAKNAMKKIQAAWGAWVPANLLAYKAEDIYVFCDDKKYRTYFSMIYEILFKKAGSYSADADAFVCGVPAFTSPHPRTRRQLYISPNQASTTEKVLAHEYVHWLTHENFYPEFYKVGGHNPFRVEGITHLVTCWAGYNLYEEPIGYVHEVLQTDAWIKADGNNLDRMLKFLFQGIETKLDDLHP